MEKCNLSVVQILVLGAIALVPGAPTGATGCPGSWTLGLGASLHTSETATMVAVPLVAVAMQPGGLAAAAYIRQELWTPFSNWDKCSWSTHETSLVEAEDDFPAEVGKCYLVAMVVILWNVSYT